MSMSLTAAARPESWPIAEVFAISRGSKTAANVVVAEISDGAHKGQGESVPYARYGLTVETVLEEINKAAKSLTADNLAQLLPHGAARNALDCALWDLRAKASGKRVWELAGLPAPQPVRGTDTTISLGAPEAMAESAARAVGRIHHAGPILKIKLGGKEKDAKLEEARLKAVRAAVPKAKLIVDANEGWTAEILNFLAPAIAEAGLAAVEQPLPVQDDEGLKTIRLSCPVFADESAHDSASLPKLAGKYQGVNIKLDKTGGLTEALIMKQAALKAGMQIMVGCMVCTSLSIAPAMLVAQGAAFADLDGALLLAKDREPGLIYKDGFVHPPEPALWG